MKFLYWEVKIMKAKIYRIAIYLRLSKEDDYLQDESNSITNQRHILNNYIKMNFNNYEVTEFTDDGFSGTNFSRPAVTELLEKAREGHFDCILVKDFSRFSRDYIELGSYLDQIFPFLGIRFISLNDSYDSKNHIGTTTELDVSFKGLMYDLYSKDLSLKVKSALHTRKEQGLYTSAHCPFGYKKDLKDRHILVIEEEEAEIVRRIFAMAQAGKTSTEIARILNFENIRTPIEFKIAKGETTRAPKGQHFQWGSSFVYSILRNRSYVGDMEYDKYEKEEVGGKNHLKPRSEWKIYYNHHPAIVSRSEFEELQKRYVGRSTAPNDAMQPAHPLIGKVICGCCKKSLILRKKNLNPYFYCPYRYYYKEANDCVDKVNLMFLEQFILFQMQTELLKQENLTDLKYKQALSIDNEISKLRKTKEQWKKKQENIQRDRLEEYEKYALGKSSCFNTVDLESEQIEQIIDQIDMDIKKYENEFSKYIDQNHKVCTESLRAELTKEMIDQMIHKIFVYDESNIEIEWNFDRKKNATL